MRLIDADALINRVVFHTDWPSDEKEAFEDEVNSEQTVEPERKTGEWNFVGNQMFECTNCGVAYTEYQFEKMRVRYNDPKFPKFCPNCGSYNGGDSDVEQ